MFDESRSFFYQRSIPAEGRESIPVNRIGQDCIPAVHNDASAMESRELPDSGPKLQFVHYIVQRGPLLRSITTLIEFALMVRSSFKACSNCIEAKGHKGTRNYKKNL